jgi:trehalose 6-phosphate synthase
VNAFPISIDFDWFESNSQRPEARSQADLVHRRLGTKRKVMLCVDRLDYTKGIDSRLTAYELMLSRKRVTVDDCVLVQIAAPSREPVFEYGEMRTKIEQLVGRINGEFSEPGRVAVHYFRRGFTREQLLPYYCAADIMVVTPLRDGMNLVCKEYIATRTDHTGVLVLSEFAGAARQLRRALLVNPRDVEGMASTMEQALELSATEAKQRMSILRTMVKRHDVHEWAEQYLEALQR